MAAARGSTARGRSPRPSPSSATSSNSIRANSSAPGSPPPTNFTRKTYGKDFDRLSESDRIAALKTMDEGKANFPGFSSAQFFNALLQITMEGFFADPMYGGNRDMAGWKMVGYPGLPATYRDEIKTYFNKKYDKPPRSIVDFS
jgi:gluconate 2-dehydrogenase gamma chain